MPSTSQPTILNRPCGKTGYGMMGLTWRGTPKPFSDSIPVLKRALELGADNWNGGEIYGNPERNSMHLLREYFTQYPEDAEKVILCVKGGTKVGTLEPDASEENVRRSVDACLQSLKGTSKKTIDVFECARVDHVHGNESAMTTLAKCVKEGKIGGVGLSEVKASTIRKAHQQLKDLGISQGVASVEIEMSLWTPDPLNNGILATCAELDIPVFAYSPLARGAFSDTPLRNNADLPDGDVRKKLPKYQDDVLHLNNQIVDAVSMIAKEKNATTPQIAIAWVRGQSNRTRSATMEDGTTKEIKMPTIIPIPGASSIERVEENFKDIILSEVELKKLDEFVDMFPTQGDRYHAIGMHHING